MKKNYVVDANGLYLPEKNGCFHKTNTIKQPSIFNS